MEQVRDEWLALPLHGQRRNPLDDGTSVEPSERLVADENAPDRSLRLQPRRDVDHVADEAVRAMAARTPHDARVNLAAVHADPEARPVLVVARDLRRGALQYQAGAGRPRRVVGRVVPTEDGHDLVADDLV